MSIIYSAPLDQICLFSFDDGLDVELNACTVDTLIDKRLFHLSCSTFFYFSKQSKAFSVHRWQAVFNLCDKQGFYIPGTTGQMDFERRKNEMDEGLRSSQSRFGFLEVRYGWKGSGRCPGFRSGQEITTTQAGRFWGWAIWKRSSSDVHVYDLMVSS